MRTSKFQRNYDLGKGVKVSRNIFPVSFKVLNCRISFMYLPWEQVCETKASRYSSEIKSRKFDTAFHGYAFTDKSSCWLFSYSYWKLQSYWNNNWWYLESQFEQKLAVENIRKDYQKWLLGEKYWTEIT